jgi:transposase
MSYTRTRGKKSEPHRDPQDPPRRRANKRRGHGNYETDRPPIFSVKGRESGEVRYEVRKRSDAETCLEVIRAAAGEKVEILNTDEWQGYARVEVEIGLAHATVRHGQAGKGERETMMAMAYEKFIATVVKVLALGCELICVCSEAFIRSTLPIMWRPMRQ